MRAPTGSRHNAARRRGDRVKRRAFISLVGGAVVAWPLAASAQEGRRVYRLGVLHQLPRAAPQFAHLVDGLRRQGFIEGRNLTVDPRGFDSRSHEYQERAAELVKSGVDVLFCGGDEALRAAQQVTQTIRSWALPTTWSHPG